MSDTLPYLAETERRELIDLVRLVDDPLSIAQCTARLEELVLCRRDGSQAYVQAVSLISGLHWSFIHDIGVAGKPSPTKPFAPLRHLSRAIVSVALNSSFVSASLIALLLYGTFAFLAWDLRPNKLLNFAKSNAESVAIVRDTTDVQWSKNVSSKHAKSTILLGELLKISSGTIELELKTGTKLVVEGPADWSVDGKNSVSLRAGKLLARVPNDAIGFTVETPAAKIVDLGTEFGVEVDAAGRTDVEVITGKVDVSYESLTTTGGSPQSVRMTAGTAKRFSKQDVGPGVAVTDVAPGMKSLLAKAAPVKSRHIFVQGATASSEFDGAPATALINGSGMKRECHATYHLGEIPDKPWHYWLSGCGKIKNEFVLFDFGQPYRLDSMKVWNLNDGRENLHTSRGVKQADIYVSTSGKWDPVKEPHEWKLVVDDYKFSAATGTDDYDTPDVIPLGGAEGRFVAIVIADHLGPDPRPLANPLAKQGDEYVGLSEVQFFGERVNRQPASRNQGGRGKQASE